MNSKRFWNILVVVTLLIALLGVGMGTYNYSQVAATAQGLSRVTSLDVSDGPITNVSDISLDTISADDGSSFAISDDWTSAGNTVADLGTVTTVDINAGTVDGTAIGGASASTGRFTNVGIGVADPFHELEVVGGVNIAHTATAADEHALELDVDANARGDIKGIDINYTTGAISTGQDAEAILVNIDGFAATGGHFAGLEVLATEGGLDDIVAVESGILVDPILQLSGTFGNMDSASTTADGDVLVAFTSVLTDVTLFASDNYTVVIGSAAKFEEVEFILGTTASNPGTKPTFEFSTGVGAWTAFTPVDGTNGFRNTGIVVWDDADVPTWAQGAGGEYLIRIARTQNSLSVVPIEDKVQISAVTEYGWDKLGDIAIRKLNATSITEQLRLSYDIDSYTSFTVASDSDLTIAPAESGFINLSGNTGIQTAANATFKLDVLGPVLLRGGDTSTGVYVDASGNVGIRQAPALTGLDVAGDFRTNASLAFWRLNSTSGAARTAALAFQTSGVENYKLVVDRAAANTNTFSIYDSRATADRLYFDAEGNIGIGTTATITPAAKILYFGETVTPTMAADTAGIFAMDIGGTAELFTIDAAGNVTQQTAHHIGFETDEPYPMGEWYCNHYLGKCVNLDVMGAMRWVEEQSGEQFIYYTDMDESEVLSWDDQQAAYAITENDRRLAEAATVMTPTLRVDAVEAYSETMTVETGEYVTDTVTTYELNAETGEVVEVSTVVATAVTVEEPTGMTLYGLKAGCEFDEDAGTFVCPVGEEDAEYEEYVPQLMPDWMAERFITLLLAPQDLSGIERPPGEFKKLVNVGDYAIWAAWAEAEVLLDLHETLWGMSPTETLGLLAVVQTRGTDFYDHRVRRATDMTVQQSLARRNRVAGYLDGLGKDTTELMEATTEDAQMRGIVSALGYSMAQLWDAM